MKKMKIMSLAMALLMALAMFAGCNTPAEPEVVPVELSMFTADLELFVGDIAIIKYTVNPEDTEVTISCDNEEVIAVNAEGELVALAAGEAIITVFVSNEVKETLTIKVTEPVVEVLDPVILLVEKEKDLEVGDTYAIEYSLENADGFETLFEAEDSKVATVDGKGLVKAVSAGETTIAVTVGEVSDTVAVTVNAKAEEVVVSSTAPVSSTPTPPPASSSSAVSSVPSSAAPIVSSTAPVSSATANSGNVGAKEQCYTIYENGKWYIILCSGHTRVAGRKDPLVSSSGADIIGCAVCKVRFTLDGKVVDDGSGSVSGSSGSASSGSSGSSSSSKVDTVAYANEVIRLINKEREKLGLGELYFVSEMVSSAVIRAQEYCDYPELKHMRPDGTFVGDLAGSFSSEGFGSEVLSWGRSTPSEAVKAWLASPGHKATLLADDYVGAAAGCYEHNGTLYWSVLFIG